MSLAQTAVSGAKWSLASIAGRRLMTVVTGVILARLLSPADFGLVAMALVFIGFVDLVRDMGTGAGIVQADRPAELLLSSVFWLNLASGVVASALLAAAAPVAALLFREPQLTSVLRVLSLSPLFAALSVVQTSVLIRELKFRRLAVAEMIGFSTGGVAGIVLALNGYGVWSLVCQSVCGTLVISAGTWLASKWRPRWMFEMSSIKSIVGFSANLTGFNILNFAIRNADSLLIGRYLGAQNLGLYDLAYRLMLSSLQLVSGAFARALFPVYMRIRDDHGRLRAAYLKVTAAVALVAFPAMLGLVGVAEPFVDVAFGSRWAAVAPLLMILAPVGALQAISTTVGNIYQATGRTDLLVRFAAVAGVLSVASFAVGLRWGVVGVAACYAVVSYALAYHLFKIPLSLIGMRVSELASAISRPVVCSVGMLTIVFVLNQLLPQALTSLARLSVLASAGAIVYLGAIWMYDRDSLIELIKLASGLDA
jgi:PST family polysaccharide transporter